MSHTKESIIATVTKIAEMHGVAVSVIRIEAGSAMVLRGLRETTEDIDCSVPADVWFSVHEDNPQYPVKVLRPTPHHPQITSILKCPGEVDMHLGAEGMAGEMVEGLWVEPVVETYARKLRLNRPKDQADLEVLWGLGRELLNK